MELSYVLFDDLFGSGLGVDCCLFVFFVVVGVDWVDECGVVGFVGVVCVVVLLVDDGDC